MVRFTYQVKGEDIMKYNKLFRYEKGGFQKRSIIVDNAWNIETSMLPKTVLPLLAKELSEVGKNSNYKRVNPFRFDSVTSKHVYIEYAEPTLHGYELKRKMVLRCSNKGNFKVPKDTFLFDLLDYFVEVQLLDKDYNFIGQLNTDQEFQVVELFSQEELLSKGFKFPA